MTEISYSDNLNIPSDLLFSVKDLMLLHDTCEQYLNLDNLCYDSNIQTAEGDRQHIEFINDVSDVMERIHNYLDSKGIHEIDQED